MGTGIALMAASIMTYQDWRLNPGGIFFSEENGTQWPFVWETWISWFLPVFALATGICLVILLLASWFKRRS